MGMEATTATAHQIATTILGTSTAATITRWLAATPAVLTTIITNLAN